MTVRDSVHKFSFLTFSANSSIFFDTSSEFHTDEGCDLENERTGASRGGTEKEDQTRSVEAISVSDDLGQGRPVQYTRKRWKLMVSL